MASMPINGRSLRSTVTSDGALELRLIEEEIEEPTGSQVLVSVEATPVNPSDLGVLIGPADASTLGPAEGGGLNGKVPEQALPIMRDRLDKPLPVGNEGAGTVVAAGPEAADLVGRTVSLVGGAMWSDYRLVDGAAVIPLPDDATPADGAALFVNPMTALSMVETMRAEGHTALVHTAAASNLGQMLVKICKDDEVGLVNIVRKPEQAATLEALGAEHVVDSSLPDFDQRLVEAISATGATLAFDAVGGGTLASDILSAMERSQPPAEFWTPYGSAVHKQVYTYGSLDFGPTIIQRTFGMRWSVGGYLLTDALGRLGGETVMAMRDRVVSEIKTTFSSSYAETIGLADILDPVHLAAAGKRGTGAKLLIDPSSDRP
ncbi:MAG TPA: zinc-binding dehydrogenase [Solirubrobacterales bacterium]|nr:zinc-binding dehydrogenase [Solirubrobacterales bacterium]HNA22946.1 zinc-binding dehydrogenase [Solirubrobacterales bacterium]HNO96161.1 zinc-binding dehydrogenase [Solirubrobacterales bacterium]